MKNINEKYLWNSSTLEKITGGKSSGYWECQGIEIDSRKVKKGDLFMALTGKNFDGHNFIQNSISSGAKAAMVKKGFIESKLNFGNIIVDDVLKSLHELAIVSRKRAENLYKTKLMAITGSSGKTSTKEMMKKAFSVIGKTYANKDSYNNHIGVPYSLSNIPRNTDFGIFEIGMSNISEIEKLSLLIKPLVAIITNISQAHIGNFRSLDGIIRAKSEIFKGMDKMGFAIVHNDENYFQKIALFAKNAGIKNLITFGANKKSDVYLKSRKLIYGGQVIEANAFGKNCVYKLNLDGYHQALNSLSILATLKTLGCDYEKAIKELYSVEVLSGRGIKHKIYIKNQESLVIDDSYNANPSSVKASLYMLNELSQGSRRVLVIGDMKELGKFSKKLHEHVAKTILKLNIELVFCVGNEAKTIYKLIKTYSKAFWFKNVNEMKIENYINLLAPRDCILIKGSRAMEMEKIVEVTIKNFRKKDK